MEKHILICGERGVGKSTLIRRLLAESTLPVGGFVTRRLTQADGDGMFPIYLHAAALPPEERPYDPGHLVGTCDSRRSVRYPEAFDRLGPPLLTSGGLLVMDELGFLERCSPVFQRAVFTLLDGPTPVLGVLRHLCNPERKRSKTIFTLLKSEQIPQMIEIINKVTGGLDKPDTGICFALPTTFVEGVNKNK